MPVHPNPDAVYDTPEPTSLAAILEPAAVDRNYAYGEPESLVATSQAVSLKRLADAAEKIATALEAIEKPAE